MAKVKEKWDMLPLGCWDAGSAPLLLPGFTVSPESEADDPQGNVTENEYLGGGVRQTWA